MSLTLLKKCQCQEKLYKCPFHETEYEVYLFGSWNNWSKGIKAKVQRTKTSGLKCYKAFFPDNLQVGVYEYKWQFIDTETNDIFWLIDTTQETVENEGWNTNNLYVVSQ
jgi:hypothetical protein